MKISTQDDLKDLGLRWRKDKDRTIIATAITRKRKQDHLYFHSPGILGIYYCRDSHSKAITAYRDYLYRCENALPEVKQTQVGDFDGIVLFKPASVKGIPRFFFRGGPRRLSQNSPLERGVLTQESTFSDRMEDCTMATENTNLPPVLAAPVFIPCLTHPKYTGIRLGKKVAACAGCMAFYNARKSKGFKETRTRRSRVSPQIPS